MKLPTYIGAFLDVDSTWRLLGMVPPMHPNVYAEHVTLKFKPTASEMEKWGGLIGLEIEIYVASIAQDARGQAVRVLLDADCDNVNPHVTISTANGTKPAYSNELLQATRVDESYADQFKRNMKAQGKTLRATIDTYPRTKRI